MNSRAKVAAGVDVAGCNAVDSVFFFLSFYYIIPGEMTFGSCLVSHGCQRVAAGPNITSILKTGRRVEEVALAPSISFCKESKNFP